MAEGIEWSSVSFVDNQECLDLIAKKPIGLLPLLDEECRYVGMRVCVCGGGGGGGGECLGMTCLEPFCVGRGAVLEG